MDDARRGVIIEDVAVALRPSFMSDEPDTQTNDERAFLIEVVREIEALVSHANMEQLHDVFLKSDQAALDSGDSDRIRDRGGLNKLLDKIDKQRLELSSEKWHFDWRLTRLLAQLLYVRRGGRLLSGARLLPHSSYNSRTGHVDRIKQDGE